MTFYLIVAAIIVYLLAGFIISSYFTMRDNKNRDLDCYEIDEEDTIILCIVVLFWPLVGVLHLLKLYIRWLIEKGHE